MLKPILAMTLSLVAGIAVGADATTTATTQRSADMATTGTTDGLHPRVAIETTLGTITLQLDGEKAPISTLNFIDYAESGYYEGTIFHRVIPNFMVQGGGLWPDMNEKSEGLRPGIRNEWKNGVKNEKGTVAMARKGGDANSGTSQFFINVADNGFLDEPRDGSGYAVFGKVAEGMDVVDKILAAPRIEHPNYPAGSAVTPREPITIRKVKVVGDYNRAALDKMVNAEKNAEEQKRMAEQAKQNEALDAVIAKVEKETGQKVETTSSGLKYAVMTEGQGAQPKKTDKVTVHYRGTLLNGKQFDSSYDRGQPATFGLNQVIAGWTEGVGMMKVGEKRKLIIPPNLGYGSRDMGDIPPNSWLVFEVELLKIQ